MTTFWQAFPWKGPFPAPGSQCRQGNRQARWVLLLQPCAIACPKYPLAPPRLATSRPCSKAPLHCLQSWLAGPVGHTRTTPPTQHRPSSQFLPCHNGEGPARVSGLVPSHRTIPDLPHTMAAGAWCKGPVWCPVDSRQLHASPFCLLHVLTLGNCEHTSHPGERNFGACHLGSRHLGWGSRVCRCSYLPNKLPAKLT